MSHYFSWLADEILEKGTLGTRTIIYCQTIKQCALVSTTLQCALVYTTPKILISEKIYEDLMQQDPKRVLLEMLHSSTPATNKEHIFESLQRERGCIRILVNIAFGMDVDCKQVHRTVHLVPVKNVEAYTQESGRAGRDRKQNTTYLLYIRVCNKHIWIKTLKKYLKSSS